MSTSIPVIDFSSYGLHVTDTSAVSDAVLKSLVDEVQAALSTYGFLYLRNHGISESKIEAVHASSTKFFELPTHTKEKYHQKGKYHGWFPAETESLDPGKPSDMKETFNYIPNVQEKEWPTKEIPKFHEDFDTFFKSCVELSRRVLSVIALGLCKERDIFDSFHTRIGQSGNETALRSLHYPALPPQKEFPAGQLRLGEHADYGSITLLFQDDVGGLEVRSPEGAYITATPIAGTVLVNIGDSMQRWSGDRLISSTHRVNIPSSSILRQRARRSVVFFVNPDQNVSLTCFDGSDLYPDISMGEYLQSKFKAAHY